MNNKDRSENEKIFRRLQELEEKAAQAERALERERQRRAEIEGQNSKLLNEKSSLMSTVNAEKQALQDYQKKYEKLSEQTHMLDSKLRDTQGRLENEELSKRQLYQSKRELEKEVLGMKQDYLRKLKTKS